MNFLAHLHLSPQTAEGCMGGLLGDFVRGRLEEMPALPQDLKASIALHRKIDAFTDSHPIWQRSRDRLRPEWRRYAGIIIDVWYDYFLSEDWERWQRKESSAIDRETFINNVHQVVRAWLSSAKSQEAIFAEARGPLSRMIEQQWLQCYTSEEGLLLTMERMSQRKSWLLFLPEVMEDFPKLKDELRVDFCEFYKDLLDNLDL